MIKTGLFAAALLVSATMLAQAQQSPPPPSGTTPPGQGTDAPGMPPDGDMDQWPGMDHHGGMHHPPPGFMMMHMMKMMAHRNASFEIRLGRGAGINVNCGHDAIKDCVDASLPLLDRANLMLDKMPRNEPPKPAP